MARRRLILLVPISLAMEVCQPIAGSDLSSLSDFVLDPVTLNYVPPEVDRIKGYKEMSKVISRKSSVLIQRYLGENYWTTSVIPVAVDSVYATFVPTKSGAIRLTDLSATLERTGNGLARMGKNQLSKLSKKRLPKFPVVGNVFTDLVGSQYVSFSKGTVHYDMRLKKRIAPELKLGRFLLSGGTEANLHGRSFSRKSIASFGYKGHSCSYRAQFTGGDIRFELSVMPVDLRLDFKGGGIQFRLSLDIWNR